MKLLILLEFAVGIVISGHFFDLVEHLMEKKFYGKI